MTTYHCRTNIELGQLLFQRHTTPTLTRSTQRQGAKTETEQNKVDKKVFPVCEGGLRVFGGISERNSALMTKGGRQKDGYFTVRLIVKYSCLFRGGGGF